MAKKHSGKSEESKRRDLVLEGYRKLAFGSCNDALRLVFLEEPADLNALAELDLFNVSEIKRPKGGGMELKFYDRFEALDRLVKIGGLSEVPDGVKAFYEAIERSVGGNEQ